MLQGLALVFGRILGEKRILVCVGSGGVGKTTTAASLALQAVGLGKKTLVLTIDPAKRLANSLGLSHLGHDITRVPDRMLEEAGIGPGRGELYAMMLDQKRAFDEVVMKHASDPDAVKRILTNPVYAQISGSLAGSQEYAALATIQTFEQDDRFEIIIVDTPPTAHALDFLDAPQKLTDAIDSPAIEWFRKLRTRGSGGWSVVGKTGAYMLKRLAKFVGSQFLDDLSVFFTEFHDVLSGFRERADQVYRLLRQDSVGFVLVASPEQMAMREAIYFYRRLMSSDMPFSAFVINRVHQNVPLTVSPDSVPALVEESPAVRTLGVTKTSIRMASDALLTCHGELQTLAEADARAVEHLREVAGPGILICQVPYQNQDIYDVERLSALGRFLMAAG